MDRAVCRSNRFGIGLLLVAACSAAGAVAPLRLSDALRIAEARAPAALAAIAAAQGARELAVAAGQLPDPVLRAGIENLPAEGSDALSLTRDFMTMRRIGLMQEVVSPAKRTARRTRGEREARRFEAEAEALRVEVRIDVARAWVDRQFARRSEALLRALADEIAMQTRALEAQIPPGRASAADVLQTRAMLALARDRILAAQRQQLLATAELERWLGEDARRPPADDGTDGDEGDLVERDAARIDALPQLEALARAVELADAEVAVAQHDRNPDWSFEIAYAKRGSAFADMLSLGVSIPLPIARRDRQDRNVAARLAERERTRELLEDARRRHRAQFATLRIEWDTLRERRRQLEASLLPLARQRIDAALAAYAGGQQGLSAVLEARRAEVDARLQILELERDAAQRWAALRYTYLEPTGAGR